MQAMTHIRPWASVLYILHHLFTFKTDCWVLILHHRHTTVISPVQVIGPSLRNKFWPTVSRWLLLFKVYFKVSFSLEFCCPIEFSPLLSFYVGIIKDGDVLYSRSVSTQTLSSLSWSALRCPIVIGNSNWTPLDSIRGFSRPAPASHLISSQFQELFGYWKGSFYKEIYVEN